MQVSGLLKCNKIMKKLIIVLSLLFIPFFASASIDTNLFYGIQNKSEVIELQEFLSDKGFLNHASTGSFYSLTLSAVKKYQASMGINQTGYVGVLTRKSINDELALNLTDSNKESVAETGSIPVPATNLQINKSGYDNSGANNVQTLDQIKAGQVTLGIPPVVIPISTPLVVESTNQPSCNLSSEKKLNSLGVYTAKLTWTSINTTGTATICSDSLPEGYDYNTKFSKPGCNQLGTAVALQVPLNGTQSDFQLNEHNPSNFEITFSRKTTTNEQYITCKSSFLPLDIQ